VTTVRARARDARRVVGSLHGIPLYADVVSSKQVDKVTEGETVDADSGAVITKQPGVLRVIKPLRVAGMRIPAGDLIYTLTNEGEGVYTAVYRGVLIRSFGPAMPENVAYLCQPVNDWWVHRTRSTEGAGWTNDTARFRGKYRSE
jgi:hypothetical protein